MTVHNGQIHLNFVKSSFRLLPFIPWVGLASTWAGLYLDLKQQDTNGYFMPIETKIYILHPTNFLALEQSLFTQLPSRLLRPGSSVSPSLPNIHAEPDQQRRG